MSKVSKYHEQLRALEQLKQQIQAMENDEELRGEIEFSEKLKALRDAYGYSSRKVLEILGISNEGADFGAGKRQSRTAKVYRNPHSGETVTTKGGNHKVLKAWKEQYGAEKVNSWVEQ